MDAIDHIDVVVSDLERSLDFYRGFLRHLGYVREGEITGEQGETITYINRPEGNGSVGVRERRTNDREAPYDRYGIGVHHIAFAAPSRGIVDRIAEWLRERGAEIEDGPLEKDYTPGYYGLFFFDPDGIKLEIVHRPAEQELATRIAELEARLAERG
jgi:glyoxylase I family protein